MISKERLEEQTLSLLCFSIEHSPFLALKVVPDLFAEGPNRLIAKTALSYISKYHNPPANQLEILLEVDLRRGAAGQLLGSAIEFLKNLKPDAAFILEELDNFIQTKNFRNSCIRALELIDADQLNEARETLHKQATLPTQGTSGILLQDPKQSLSFLDKNETEEFFSSGISLLDQREVTPARKTLMILIAASGCGKSWYLTEVGKAGLQHHHTVLHITLELSEEKTARRYIQSIFSLTRHDSTNVRIPYFVGTTQIDFNEFSREGITKKRNEIAQKLAKINPKLLIKEFPTSTLTVEQLYMYLESLEQEKNFKPSLVLIDYGDLMRLDTKDLRVDTGRLYKELRGLAVSKNLAIVTATQGNRESASSKLVSSTNISEDWSKVCTSDIVLTYSQTAQEKALGLARIFVAKSRDSGDRFLTLISQCYDIGQFAVNSIPMNADISNQLSQHGVS